MNVLLWIPLAVMAAAFIWFLVGAAHEVLNHLGVMPSELDDGNSKGKGKDDDSDDDDDNGGFGYGV